MPTDDELLQDADAAEKEIPDYVRRNRRLEDFRYDEQQGKFWDVTTGNLMTAAAVNGAIPKDLWPTVADDKGKLKHVPPAVAINRVESGLTVEDSTWWPGQPQFIQNRVTTGHGLMDLKGAVLFNSYRPPPEPDGDPERADRWLDHVARLVPDATERKHLLSYFAHMVQKPGEKANHGVLIGGPQGIGKDTLLQPTVHAVGPWNAAEVAPHHLTGKFNDFYESVLLRVSEARDLGGEEVGRVNRYQLYESIKTLTTVPPDVLRMNRKHEHERSVQNCLRVVITTNYKDGLYLPVDDRRFFVLWSECRREDFSTEYWTDLHRWFESGGYGHVAAFLADMDISSFDPKAPPPWTQAKAEMVDAGRDPSLDPIDELLEKLGHPPAVTLTQLVEEADEVMFDDAESVRELLQNRRNARRVPHLMQVAGYVKVMNPGSGSGKFKINKRNVAVYARLGLTLADRLAAVDALKRRVEAANGQS